MLLQIPNLTLATLPSNHDIRHLLRQILSLANEAGERQRTPLAMSQKIAQHLYKTPSQMGREIYVALLDQLCHSFEEVAKEVIPWLVESEDEVCQFRSRSWPTLTVPPLSGNTTSQSPLPCFAVVLSLCPSRTSRRQTSCSLTPRLRCKTLLRAWFANVWSLIRPWHPKPSLPTRLGRSCSCLRLAARLRSAYQ